MSGAGPQMIREIGLVCIGGLRYEVRLISLLGVEVPERLILVLCIISWIESGRSQAGAGPRLYQCSA